jgi:hypothetical protein
MTQKLNTNVMEDIEYSHVAFKFVFHILRSAELGSSNCKSWYDSDIIYSLLRRQTRDRQRPSHVK